MQIHFLANGFSDVHQLSDWDDNIRYLKDAMPEEFHNVLQRSQCMDAWVQRIDHIVQYQPYQWKHYLEELRSTVKSMWCDFTKVWSNHSDEHLLNLLCTTATTHALGAGCSFVLSRKMDSKTKTYTKEMRFRMTGSDAKQRYHQPTQTQTQKRILRERVLTAAAAKPLVQPQKRQKL